MQVSSGYDVMFSWAAVAGEGRVNVDDYRQVGRCGGGLSRDAILSGEEVC